MYYDITETVRAYRILESISQYFDQRFREKGD